MDNEQTVQQLDSFSSYPLLDPQRSEISKTDLPNEFTEQAQINLKNLDMVLVKGGTFMMGAADTDSLAKEHEKPQHSVTLNSFYIGKYPVTQEQFYKVMDYNPSHFHTDNNNPLAPVEMVGWFEACEFCRRLNKLTGKMYRLPTEAEWEYAAKGGHLTKEPYFNYAGSDILGDLAWYRVNQTGKTRPVGRQNPNQLGLYDMSGNVFEWCQDWYSETYYKDREKPATNPIGPKNGEYRVLRGGCWCYYDNYCRVTHRDFGNPNDLYDIIGFRVAMQL